ncbi:MAG TPA: hypothetical protein VIU12_10660 [Chryseolinea sp.]
MHHYRIVTLILLSFACVFLSACHEDQPASRTIFTLQVDEDYFFVGDSWIFATDQNGEVLDAKSYSKGQTITLSTNKTVDKVNITFFNSLTGTTSFNTYAGYPTGASLRLSAPLPDGEPKSGAAAFNILNYDASGLLEFSNGYRTDAKGVIAGNAFKVNLSFYNTPSDMLITGYRADVPVYNWAKGLKDGDVVDRDFTADFEAFPHQVKLDFEGSNTAYVYARSAGQATYLKLIDTNQLGIRRTDHPVIGYIDGFDVYQTWVQNMKPGGSVTYFKTGAPTLSFTMPSFTFSLTSREIQNLSFDFSEDYTYYSSLWYYTGTWWGITAPPGTTVTQFSIPTEIATKYPDIDASKFKFSGVHFTKVLDGGSYLDAVQGSLAQPPANQEYYIFTPEF